MTNEKLVKVRILLDEGAIKAESVWAKSLGDNLYQIANIPFFAYGINYQDIVYATAASKETGLEVQKVVEPKGHRTVRVFFKTEKIKVHVQRRLLNTLKKYDISFESAGYLGLFALDVNPESDFEVLQEHLNQYAEQGILDFELTSATSVGCIPY